MSNSPESTRGALAPWIAAMFTPGKMKKWSDVRHKAHEQILSSKATAHPYLLDVPFVSHYIRRIRQGQD